MNAQENPEEMLESNVGYSDYLIEFSSNPNDYVICVDWDDDAGEIYVLTLGEESDINV